MRATASAPSPNAHFRHDLFHHRVIHINHAVLGHRRVGEIINFGTCSSHTGKGVAGTAGIARGARRVHLGCTCCMHSVRKRVSVQSPWVRLRRDETCSDELTAKAIGGFLQGAQVITNRVRLDASYMTVNSYELRVTVGTNAYLATGQIYGARTRAEGKG